MEIRTPVILGGERDQVQVDAIVDTGATRTMIPLSVARRIGALRTNQTVKMRGIDNISREYPVVVISITIQQLDIGPIRFAVVASDRLDMVLLGMDLMQPLDIDVSTGSLKVRKNQPILEAFKTIFAVSAIGFIALKGLEALSLPDEDEEEE